MVPPPEIAAILDHLRAQRTLTVAECAVLEAWINNVPLKQLQAENERLRWFLLRHAIMERIIDMDHSMAQRYRDTL